MRGSLRTRLLWVKCRSSIGQVAGKGGKEGRRREKGGGRREKGGGRREKGGGRKGDGEGRRREEGQVFRRRRKTYRSNFTCRM
jgi:hypothetical protein